MNESPLMKNYSARKLGYIWRKFLQGLLGNHPWADWRWNKLPRGRPLPSQNRPACQQEVNKGWRCRPQVQLPAKSNGYMSHVDSTKYRQVQSSKWDGLISSISFSLQNQYPAPRKTGRAGRAVLCIPWGNSSIYATIINSNLFYTAHHLAHPPLGFGLNGRPIMAVGERLLLCDSHGHGGREGYWERCPSPGHWSCCALAGRTAWSRGKLGKESWFWGFPKWLWFFVDCFFWGS